MPLAQELPKGLIARWGDARLLVRGAGGSALPSLVDEVSQALALVSTPPRPAPPPQAGPDCPGARLASTLWEELRGDRRGRSLRSTQGSQPWHATYPRP